MDQRSPNSNEPAQFTMRGLLIAVAIFAILVACFSALQRWQTRLREEVARLEELNQQTKAAIVKGVEALCAELGRAPVDQIELEELLGRSMPSFYHKYGESPIEYRRTGADGFTLSYFFWDPWLYDSKSPKAGWIQVP